MPDLRADCGQALCRFDLTVGNVRPWLLTAEKYGCSAAVDRCVAFADDNISQILECASSLSMACMQTACKAYGCVVLYVSWCRMTGLCMPTCWTLKPACRVLLDIVFKQ